MVHRLAFLAGLMAAEQGMALTLSPTCERTDRLTQCAGGSSHAIATTLRARSVAPALAATEVLRAPLAGSKPVGRKDPGAAVRAVYGKQMVFRETEETCGCHVTYGLLRPKGMTAFGDRTDTAFSD